jgi:hypothetical protein
VNSAQLISQVCNRDRDGIPGVFVSLLYGSFIVTIDDVKPLLRQDHFVNWWCSDQLIKKPMIQQSIEIGDNRTWIG